MATGIIVNELPQVHPYDSGNGEKPIFRLDVTRSIPSTVTIGSIAFRVVNASDTDTNLADDMVWETNWTDTGGIKTLTVGITGQVAGATYYIYSRVQGSSPTERYQDIWRFQCVDLV